MTSEEHAQHQQQIAAPELYRALFGLRLEVEAILCREGELAGVVGWTNVRCLQIALKNADEALAKAERQ